MCKIQTLTIIGNGFDLHHKIKSSVEDYRQWLKKNHQDFYNKFIQLYHIENTEGWKDFERILGTLDIKAIANEFIQKCKEKGYGKYEYVIADEKSKYLVFLLYIKHSFREWISELNNPNEDKKGILAIENGFFINFNYTYTLQNLYHIKEEQILHIHGKKDSKLQDFVIGHNVPYEDAIKRILRYNNNDTGIDVIAAHWDKTNTSVELIERGCREAAINNLEDLKKDTDGIIREHKKIFESFCNVNTINVYGFSFSDIDLPYLDEIIRIIDVNKVKWNISYNTPDDYKKIIEYMELKKIARNNIEEDFFGTYRIKPLNEFIQSKA